MIRLATETAHREFGGVRLAGIRTWWSNRQRRRRFNRMLALDNRMLDDIGVTRAEVEFASRLPLAVNAGIELRRIAHKRRARERGFAMRY